MKYEEFNGDIISGETVVITFHPNMNHNHVTHDDLFGAKLELSKEDFYEFEQMVFCGDEETKNLIKEWKKDIHKAQAVFIATETEPNYNSSPVINKAPAISRIKTRIKQKLRNQKQVNDKQLSKLSGGSNVTFKDPKDIHLSHPAARSKNFSDIRKGTVGELANTLKQLKANSGTEEGLKALNEFVSKIPAIAITKIKGKLYSANNRRLRAFKEADVDIPTRPADKDEIKVIKQRLNKKN